jgi:hypothetical protein
MVLFFGLITSIYLASLSLFLTVDNKGGVKISDFGISKKVEEGNDCLNLAVVVTLQTMLTIFP